MKEKLWVRLALVMLLLTVILPMNIPTGVTEDTSENDWPMMQYDPACTSFSPSSAPNTNATAWVSDLPGGTVWAYPVVADGKVFIGAGGYLNAFDENTGSLVWSFRAPAQPGYPGATAVADGRIFFGTAEPGPGGAIYALNTATGEQLWNFTTEGYVRASPVVVEDRLYIGGDLDSTGKVYCIDTTTGTSIWNYTTQDRMSMVAVAYGNVYAGCGHWQTSTKAAIYCLDMYDGSLVWSYDTGRDLGGALSVANGKVYSSASYEGWNCAIFALNATNGDLIWSTTRYSNGEAGGVSVAYGKVFVRLGYGANGVYALNEINGDEVWTFPEGGKGGRVVADGKVFFGVGAPYGMFYAAVNQATGVVMWSYKLGGAIHSRSSAIANGQVFVADHYDKKLYAFGPALPAISATVDIDPDTLNLKSNGEFVTAYIELPEGYSVADIVLETVYLDGIQAITDPTFGFVTDPDAYLTDHDGDGILERMVKFDRATVRDTLTDVTDYEEGTKFYDLTLTVTGQLADGTLFEGTDIVTVIKK